MKFWLKSFFITLIVTISSGFILLFVMDLNDKSKIQQDVTAELQLDKKHKRMPTKQDILDILQVIVLGEKKIVMEVLINPVDKTISVEKIGSEQKLGSKSKTIEELYDYGGITFLMKEINKNLNKNIDKYMVIENRDKLEDILDTVGNIDVKGVFYGMSEVNVSSEFGILDEEAIISLFEHGASDFVVNEITKQYYIQKISLLDKEIGEELFKNIINATNSNISYGNYKNLTEIPLNNFN